MGLFALFYAGMRGISAQVVDALPEAGGQLTALYPEKFIFDVAGFPKVLAKDLVGALREQSVQFGEPIHLSQRVIGLEEDGGHFVLVTDTGRFPTKSLVLAAGIGAFSPRQLPQPCAAPWYGRGIDDVVTNPEVYRGKRVVIVGGGDSAFDWALHLEPIARSVALVHRRDAFRAHERTVQQVRASTVEIITKAEVSAVNGDAVVESVDITVDGETTTRPCQAVVAALGFIADLGPLQQWGIEVSKRHILVAPSMQTNLPRVFAAGDITEYAGKVRLIAVGFGEAATAVNNATVAIDPSAKVFPGHSSEAS